MGRVWAIAPGASPALRFWGDEVVVHHALSNDTHRLSKAAGFVLARLITAQVDGETKDQAFQPDDDTQVTLAVLADLGLVKRC